MKVARFVQPVAGVVAIAALGTGCGGSQLPTAATGSSVAAAASPGASDERSWMSPRVRRGDLLYVSDTGGRVYVYSYPTGEHVGTLTGFKGPQGVCSDAAGDVYVVDTPAVAISKFARGGTKPLAVLHVFGYYPEGCAVDAATGDLAVADYAGNPYLGPGAVTIFRKGKGMGRSYQDPNVNQFYFCSYDAKGNLYADGTNAVTTQAELAEIPRGGTSFTDITLDKNVGPYPLGIQWDGKYLALQGFTRALYRIAISGSTGHIVQTMHFKGDHSNLVSQFTIAGRTIVIPYGTARRLVRKVGLWPYPDGGAATKTFAPPPRVAELFSTTVTLAPK
jgi:hypothetical protein